jgi:cytochrome c553
MRIHGRGLLTFLQLGSIALLGVSTAFAAEPEAVEVAAKAAPAAPGPSTLPFEPDAAAGAARAALCFGCHGPDGNAPNNPMWPKLASQQPAYIVKQLRDFKAGRRVDPMMTAMVAPLSDHDIVNLAAHFASLTIRVGAGDVSLAAKGERLYREGRPDDHVLACISCHGVNAEGFGVGIEGGFPAIGGQKPDYVIKQLQSFRSRARTNDWEGIMQYVAANLSDEEIAALAAYLVSVPREPLPEAPEVLATGG